MSSEITTTWEIKKNLALKFKKFENLNEPQYYLESETQILTPVNIFFPITIMITGFYSDNEFA